MSGNLSVADLPGEIRSLILCHSPDFHTLASLIFTCRSLHAAFRSERSRILQSTFDTFIPKHVQYDALSALVCRRNRLHQTRLFKLNLFSQHLTELVDARLPTRPGSPDFFDMVTNHVHVVDLTQDLAKHCFDIAHRQGYHVSQPQPLLSYDELVRIQRAVYRIEIYNSFLVDGHFKMDIRDDWLVSFPAWELDEMGCVYDYLCTRMAFLAERVSEACLAGGAEYFRCRFSVISLPSRGISHWIEPVFREGIFKCHEIIMADNSPKDEVARLRDVHAAMQAPSTLLLYPRGQGLSSALTERQGISDELPCCMLTRFDRDGVEGPNKAWKWQYANDSNESTGWYQFRLEDLAEWCSTVWDEERLRSWHLFDRPRKLSSYAEWVAARKTRLEIERRARLLQDPHRPKPIPCVHGAAMHELAPEKGPLYYRSPANGNVEWGTCKDCAETAQQSVTWVRQH